MPYDTYDTYRLRVLNNCVRAKLGGRARKRTLRTFDIAYEFHKNQEPRITGEPFISHPVAVHEILVECGVYDAVTLRIALLHDVIEDTDATLEDIAECGVHTYMPVSRLSRTSKPDDIDKTTWRERYLIKLVAHGSIRDILVKLADRIHNLETSDVLPKYKQERAAREAGRYLLPVAKDLNVKLAERLEREVRRILPDEMFVQNDLVAASQ